MSRKIIIDNNWVEITQATSGAVLFECALKDVKYRRGDDGVATIYADTNTGVADSEAWAYDGFVDSGDAPIADVYVWLRANTGFNTASGGSGAENSYANIAALLADQANQKVNNIQYVADASGDATVVTGYAYYDYLGTTVGDLTDYRKLTEEESNNLNIAVATNTTHRTSDGKDHSDVVANNAKVTNATHTGEVTGSGALTIASDVVDLDNLKEDLKVRVTASVATSYAINHNDGNVFVLTMTDATTFTDSNLPTGTSTKDFEVLLTGNYVPTFPAYWTADPDSQAYDGTVNNRIMCEIINGTGASEDVNYFIKNLA